jgi:hypothetical protein
MDIKDAMIFSIRLMNDHLKDWTIRVGDEIGVIYNSKVKAITLPMGVIEKSSEESLRQIILLQIIKAKKLSKKHK